MLYLFLSLRDGDTASHTKVHLEDEEEEGEKYDEYEEEEGGKRLLCGVSISSHLWGETLLLTLSSKLAYFVTSEIFLYVIIHLLIYLFYLFEFIIIVTIFFLA